jgi:general secretion pathway protein A
VGIIINPKLESTEFIQEVLYQFGLPDIPDTKVMCLRVLNDHMLNNLKAGIETVLIVGEAQLLSDSTFEEIRLLLNFQLNDRFLMTVILLGQPELMSRVKKIEQLNQRIAVKYHLKPFDLQDTLTYITFRQQKAGREEPSAFSDDTVARIFEHTGGVPRKINNLCDLSLLRGFSAREKLISPDLVENIISDGALF